MAFSPLRSKALHHVRSLSLPSTSHPSITHFDENLSRVRSSEASTCSTFSSKLNGLKSLHECIDDLLVLPQNQQIISQESQEKWFGQVLSGSIKLMDACSTAKDVLSNTKQNVQDLLSSLRRKDVNGTQCYLNSKTKAKKVIQKSLKDLRRFRSKQNVLSSEKDHETMALVCMLKEAESVTISMLESLLSYVMGQSRQNGWSLVSKLMHSKKVSNHGEATDLNEFVKVESLLQSQDNEDLVNHLKGMDSSMQALEEELECLFRQLIKTRVSFLNILNN